MREIQASQKRDRRITLGIGLATVTAVVIMGVLNLIFG